MGGYQYNRRGGFTLIELSIVLVIIGLIVGGVLAGQSLIAAAAVRAQITQIEKFNTATNAFRDKYGYLPGDIKDPDASRFGFISRGIYEGQGDGNGILEGNFANNSTYICRLCQIAGENVVFWEDLSTAKLIDQSFTAASSTALTPSLTAANINSLLPIAKIGNGNFIYAYTGLSNLTSGASNGTNYFGLSNISSSDSTGDINATPGLTVQQAYAIDKKVDDGFPQSGNVFAEYVNRLGSGSVIYWAGGPYNSPTYTTATSGSSTSCFDNGSSAGAAQQYSLEISNGSNVNCALSFRFQ